MNTAKIAALYADPVFNCLLRFPQADPSTTLTEQVKQHALRQARIVSADGRTYHFDASNCYKREKHRNDVGDRVRGFLDEHCTKRQADWLLRQLPGWPETSTAHLRKGLPEQDTILVTVWGYADDNDDLDTLACLRYGAREDFETVLRGMASIRRKRRKRAKKLEAQLRAYHRQQELATLRRGHWLGAEKALTTAARVNEPGVPFMGDTNLTLAQRRQMGLHYWTVSADKGMSAAFPTGTGLALKPVKRAGIG